MHTPSRKRLSVWGVKAALSLPRGARAVDKNVNSVVKDKWKEIITLSINTKTLEQQQNKFYEVCMFLRRDGKFPQKEEPQMNKIQKHTHQTSVILTLTFVSFRYVCVRECTQLAWELGAWYRVNSESIQIKG